MALQSISMFPVTKGIVASNQPLAQPKGSVSRASNLIMTSRGGLTPVDGSGVLNLFNGAVQTTNGKFLAETLFDPTGVAPYYLALVQALDQHLGAPKNLSLADGGAGGGLTGTFFYVVTAIDGRGGETTVSNEATITVAANHKITLTWNVVPNAYGYNIYRSTTTGTEILLIGSTVPVLQPLPLAATVSFTDTGLGTATTVGISTAVSAPNSIPPPARYINWMSTTPVNPQVGQSFTASGMTPSSFNGTYFVTATNGAGKWTSGIGSAPSGTTATGGTATFGGFSPPVSDTSSQTALVLMPQFVNWGDQNIVALFPATVPGLNVPPVGAVGGSGTGSFTGSSTVNGGIQGLVSLAPMFKQFTNRMAIALGNGFAPQLFSDASGTTVNPAFVGIITAISVDANGVVTVTTGTNHGLDPTQGVGTNVVIQGTTDPAYSTNGNGSSAFVVLSIPAANQVKVRNLNAIGHGPSNTGTMTVTTIPFNSTFVPAFPQWTTNTLLSVGDIIVPATQPSPAIYVTVIQGGTTGAVEPVWPTGGLASIGKRVSDTGGSKVIYQVTALLNSAAPPPPGAAHIEVFSGALWVLNTWFTNTSTGLDGPTALRQCSINNPNSWNPINQAYIDKDDGSEGMSLAKFTITAQGIPPEGSLILFKNFSPYQVIGVFGAANFQIQAVSSDMGCIAPRTTIFVPGFGIMRYTHLGVGKFDGVKDEIISEQIRPYLFPDSNRNFSDITAVDATWLPVSWAALTANPPQYALAMPVGNSNSMLTRIFLFDLVLKGWMIADLPANLGGGGGGLDPPMAISSMAQVRSTVSNPITIFGGFADGALQRWQAGDLAWFTGGGSSQTPVTWSTRSNTVASQDTDQRIYARRLVVTGTNTGVGGTISVSINQSGVLQGTLTFSVPANSDFDIDVAVGLTGKRYDAVVTSSLNIEIDGMTWETEPRPAGFVVNV
jgi:hypothetical protein